MNYIILDMEWDSVYFSPEKRFINQILQIGAVKLDDDLSVCETFEINVRSSVSKRVSRRFTELTGITKQMMLAGVPLEEAVLKFNSFAGKSPLLMTWSNSDLYTIIQNQNALLKGVKFEIGKYCDLQKYVQNEFKLSGFECVSQISLNDAAKHLGIETDEFTLHTAKDDSVVTAQIFKTCYNKSRFNKCLIDASKPEFYARLSFKPYYISDIESKYLKRKNFAFRCETCNKKLKPIHNWRFYNRNFTNEFYCDKCDKKYIGRVSARKTYDSVVVKQKLMIKKPKKEKNNDLQSVSS